MTRILIGALLASVATSALAANIPYGGAASYPAPVYVPPPFTWTGVYFGLNAAWGWAGPGNDTFGDPSGGAFGGTVGYNYQMGQIVFGAEADWDWAGISHTQTYLFTSNELTINETLTARARVGYAMGRALIYATAGYGGAGTSATFSNPLAYWGGSQDKWVSGGAIGAGFEYAITNNITAKAEYLYLPLSSATYFTSPFYSNSTSIDLSLLRLGVNYKF